MSCLFRCVSQDQQVVHPPAVVYPVVVHCCPDWLSQLVCPPWGGAPPKGHGLELEWSQGGLNPHPAGGLGVDLQVVKVVGDVQSGSPLERGVGQGGLDRLPAFRFVFGRVCALVEPGEVGDQAISQLRLVLGL